MPATDPSPFPVARVTDQRASARDSRRAGANRDDIVAKAREAWIAKLIDVSRRNNLLFFRPLKLGTVEFENPPEAPLLGLIAGERTPVARLFPTLPLESDIDEGTILLNPDLIPEDNLGVVRRLKEIQRKAIENFEERGLETMYLTYGMATWSAPDGGRNPDAPVLLIPVKTDGKEGRTALLRTGDPELNLALLHALEDTFGIHVASLEPELDDRDHGSLLASVEGVFSQLERVASEVPEFAIRRRLVVGNFSFQKMAMVRDLQRNDALAANDIIAAIAGDVNAQTDLASRGDGVFELQELDRLPAEAEFLVLDADASQRLVVAQATSGSSGVISGPPGTGKSQSIANLIAEMISKGKRVLFVAEKRAALEVVKSRLASLGLGHVLLDLHGAVQKSQIMAEFARTLEVIKASPDVDLGALHRDYAVKRDLLNDHAQRINEPMRPSRLSPFQLQACLLVAAPDTQTRVRWRGAALKKLEADAVRRVCDLLEEAGRMADLLMGTNRSPWANAIIESVEQLQGAVDLVDLLAGEALPAVQGLLDDVCVEAGLVKPRTYEQAAVVCSNAEEAGELQAQYGYGLYRQPLAEMATQMLPGTRAGLRGFVARRRRRVRRAYRACLQLRHERAALATVHDEIATAQRLLSVWALDGATAGAPRGSARAEELRAAINAAEAGLHTLQPIIPERQLSSMPADDVDSLVARLAADTLTPGKRLRLSQITSELRSLGAASFLEEIVRSRMPAQLWADGMRYAWWASCLDAARLADLALATFDGRSHDRIVAQFQALDRDRIRLAVARVRSTHAQKAIAVMNANPEGATLLRREAAKRTRHLPIRTLIGRAGDVVTAVKPCWMASPLAVSQLLDTGTQLFDLVIFDEASQVLPEDAVTSIVRGKAAVVAGDRNQLPPTPFFVAGVDADEEAAEEAENTEGFESILDVFSGFFVPWSLQWHYRSRDERLIAFSNLHLYQNSLITFPSVGRTAPLRHVLVSGNMGDIDTRSSGAEVQRVVELVAEHARSRPEQSLGVIAMGIYHARRIETLLEERRRGDPRLDAFLDRDGLDGFFVKNLERVQGDERDSIILSVGYGKDSSGKLLYRFGPLLSKGGERRLNVAITRARDNATLVSSFSHLDMDPSRSSARGVELLREYLEYVAYDGLRLGETGPTGVEADPFEQDVQSSLEARGLQLIPQYGASNYRIDLVAKHPTRTGALVLAIECDGATYHSAPMARDRDRLRQEHLEALGWTFCRIWSTDWFLHKQDEIERVLAAYQRAVEHFDRDAGSPLWRGDSTNSVEASPSRIEPPGVNVLAARASRPRITPGLDITLYTTEQLVALVKWVQSDGMQRTDAEIAAEVREALQLRNGSRIEAAIAGVIQHYWRLPSSMQGRRVLDAGDLRTTAASAEPETPHQVARSQPAAMATTKSAAELLADRERELTDAIATGSRAYRNPARKLARLIACRDAADTPERAWAWYTGAEPRPEGPSGPEGKLSRERATGPPPQRRLRRAGRPRRTAPLTGGPVVRLSASPSRHDMQQSLNSVLHTSRECLMPGCGYIGPPGTCELHDLS